MRTKNGRDLPIEQVTAENYIVPKGEELVYHVKQEVIEFHRKTGKRISSPRIQKYGRKIWESVVRDSLLQQGYTIEVLHDPTGYIAAQQAKRAESKAAAKAAERAALKAEIMAELRAAGVIPDAGNTTGEQDGKKGPGRPPKDKE